MANNQQPNKTVSGANIQKAQQQNATSSSGQFGTEFASETDVQAVKQKNAQSTAKTNQNQQIYRQQQD